MRLMISHKITPGQGRQLRAKIEALIDAKTDAAYAGPMPADADLLKEVKRRERALEKFICKIEGI